MQHYKLAPPPTMLALLECTPRAVPNARTMDGLVRYRSRIHNVS